LLSFLLLFYGEFSFSWLGHQDMAPSSELVYDAEKSRFALRGGSTLEQWNDHTHV